MEMGVAKVRGKNHLAGAADRTTTAFAEQVELATREMTAAGYREVAVEPCAATKVARASAAVTARRLTWAASC